MDYIHFGRVKRFKDLFAKYQRAIAVFSSEFEEKQVKLSLAIMDSLADVYKEA
jgi:hypothetical protein